MDAAFARGDRFLLRRSIAHVLEAGIGDGEPLHPMHARDRMNFLRFKAYCAKLDLPHLPASPQMVAAFLTTELDKGRPHLNRLIKSISTTHHKADLPDPCTDLLVRALLRLAIDEPSTKGIN